MIQKLKSTATGLAALAGISIGSMPSELVPKVESIYDFKVNNIEKKSVKLDKFKGKVLIVVNVASKCGLTPQYESLEALYRKYKDKGLVVLGFPANDFGNQEPGTEEEIQAFCSTKYDVTFPMFSKIVVTGDDTNPMYRWLIEQSGDKAPIEWNFAKFIVGRDGKAVARFGPRLKPTDKTFVAAIEKALAAK